MKRPFVAALAALIALSSFGSSAALARDGGFPPPLHERARDGHHDGRGWGDNHRERDRVPHRWERGNRLPPAYHGPRHAISHPGRYHLRPAPRGHQWVRAGNDALLVISRSGLIVDVRMNLFR